MLTAFSKSLGNTLGCLEIHVRDTHADLDLLTICRNCTIPFNAIGIDTVVDLIKIVHLPA